MKKKKNKKILKYLFLILILALIAFIFFKTQLKDSYNFIHDKFTAIDLAAAKQVRGKQEHWITVFVHGTFNAGLGLLNVFDVINDKVAGTQYAKVIKKMRKDPFFYQEQPILQRGLVAVDKPGFEKIEMENKIASYPLFSFYQEILGKTKSKDKELNSFYNFGWTGLMSQHFRRRDAIRLYNALNEEIDKFHQKGIYPKIRLIAHSHGGNVCLNLGAINEVMQKGDSSYKKMDFDFIEPEEDRNIAIDSIAEMRKLIFSLPIEERAKALKGQKLFDYIPRDTPLVIDEFLAYGTPLQIETCYMFFSPTFKNSYNIYSSQDYVQTLDVISTKKYLNKQRILHFPKQADNRFIQLKIMIDRPLESLDSPSDKEDSSILQSLLSSVFFSDKFSRDPSHKDLWFFAWNPEFTQPNYPFNPIPAVVFTPIVLQLTNEVSNNDLDLHIRVSREFINFELLKHNSSIILNEFKLPFKFFSELREKSLKWKPENLTREMATRKLQMKLST